MADTFDEEFTSPRPPSVDGERLLGTFKTLVHHLGGVYPSATEIILHDFSRLPNSIVAISGNITGRKVGGPATDYLLAKVRSEDFDDEVGYTTTTPDGRRLRASTMVIRDAQNIPIGALCTNVDVSTLATARDLLTSLIQTDTETYTRPAAISETYPESVSDLSTQLIDRAIRHIGVPAAEMRKEQKVEVVRELEEAGFFLIREGVDTVARVLDVTKFTIYNYRNELAGRPADPSTLD